MYSVCEMRNNLDCLAEIIASSFSFYDMLIHLASRDTVLSSQGDVEVSFVVSKIKVDFAAIVKYEAFSVSGQIRQGMPAL